jgi:hypothetical protein
MAKDFVCKMRFLFIPCEKNKWRPRFLNSRFLFYYGVVLLLLKLLIIPFLFYFPNTTFFADVTQVNLVEFTNLARQQLGYPVLKENQVLNQAAWLKAQDMLEKGYFAHYSPEGTSPWYWLEKSGYVYRAAGENLAIGFLESEQVHQAWMNSLSHRNNILNPNYQEIGIAVVKGSFQGNQTALVVQLLGTQRTVVPQPEPVKPLEPETEQPAVPASPIEEQVIGEEIIDQQPEREDLIDQPAEPIISQPETEIEEETDSEQVSPIVVLETKEIEIKRTPILGLFQFMMSDYYKWIQRVIYFSLFLIILLLVVTFYCDIFVYRKFKIDYKDVVFKTIGFSALWLSLIYLDKLIILEIISQNFRIS